MSALELDVHGVSARVRCERPDVLEALRLDFEYFSSPFDDAADVELVLEARRDDARGLPLFPWRGRVISIAGGTRLIRHDDGAVVRYDYAARRGRISHPDPERLRELAHFALQSRVGEELDRRGLHRVHALGFEWKGDGGLVLLPSGGGKSTLALELLRSTGAGLLSDDAPLADARGMLRAFPLRLGFRPDAELAGVPAGLRRTLARRDHGPKVVVGVPFFRERVADRAPLRWLLIGRRTGGPPALRPAGRAAALAALSRDLVLGLGVAQMAEYMLRPSLDLPRIAAARVRTALELVRRAQAWEFELGDRGPEAAAAELSAFVSRRSR